MSDRNQGMPIKRSKNDHSSDTTISNGLLPVTHPLFSSALYQNYQGHPYCDRIASDRIKEYRNEEELKANNPYFPGQFFPAADFPSLWSGNYAGPSMAMIEAVGIWLKTGSRIGTIKINIYTVWNLGAGNFLYYPALMPNTEPIVIVNDIESNEELIIPVTLDRYRGIPGQWDADAIPPSYRSMSAFEGFIVTAEPSVEYEEEKGVIVGSQDRGTDGVLLKASFPQDVIELQDRTLAFRLYSRVIENGVIICDREGNYLKPIPIEKFANDYGLTVLTIGSGQYSAVYNVPRYGRLKRIRIMLHSEGAFDPALYMKFIRFNLSASNRSELKDSYIHIWDHTWVHPAVSRASNTWTANGVAASNCLRLDSAYLRSFGAVEQMYVHNTTTGKYGRIIRMEEVMGLTAVNVSSTLIWAMDAASETLMTFTPGDIVWFGFTPESFYSVLSGTALEFNDLDIPYQRIARWTPPPQELPLDTYNIRLDIVSESTSVDYEVGVAVAIYIQEDNGLMDISPAHISSGSGTFD